MAIHNERGAQGEDYAAWIMRRKGYWVLDRNWRVGHLEMDVICWSWREIVFVEVKTRTGQLNNKLPEEYVDADKQRHMVSAANAYMKMKGYSGRKTIRFDVIGIDMTTDGKITGYRHYKNAFVPKLKTISERSFIGKWRWPKKKKQTTHGL